MFWGNYPQTNTGAAERAAESAELKAERSARIVQDLQTQVERLALACQAMWELLQQCSDLTPEDLDKKILEIDARDGCVDGRITVQPVDCPACGRKTSTKRNTCIMCGAPIKRPNPFSG